MKQYLSASTVVGGETLLLYKAEGHFFVHYFGFNQKLICTSLNSLHVRQDTMKMREREDMIHRKGKKLIVI